MNGQLEVLKKISHCPVLFLFQVTQLSLGRLLRRKQLIEATLATFQSLDFPMREYAADDVDAYLARIENDGNLPAEVRLAAHDLEFQLALFEQIGMIAGSRSRSAVEAAYNAYAKKFSAKEFHSNTAAER